jgi:hypothetical protein
MSAVILAVVAVDPADQRASRASVVLAAFLDDVGPGLLIGLDDAVAIRRSDPAVTAEERGRLAAAAALIRGHRWS